MGTVTCSLWLPIRRPNFFSRMSDRALPGPDGRCRSPELAQPDYVPPLRASVMRRLLEVLPRSFGYEIEGFCEFSDELDETTRPVSLTMTMTPSRAAGMTLIKAAAAANDDLQRAGVTELTLRVDEHGNYTFTATRADGLTEAVVKDAVIKEALLGHVLAVFGGDFAVDRLRGQWPRGFNEGADAVRRYNGLTDESRGGVSMPLGALSFFQLNILVESLCNQALLPAVFFEHYDSARAWLVEHRGKTSVMTTVAEVVTELATEADATEALGQVIVLHRFLSVSQGTLQWLKRSVESVRRSLLDKMMLVEHRQARLIQLDLGANQHERTPELTGAATESQMRGYVMLVGAMIPLVFNIVGAATTTLDHLRRLADRSAHGHDLDPLLHDLDRELYHWRAQLQGLEINIHSLETAVEHDWQERLYYQQEQARSEQEAIAEIERGRRGRAENKRLGETAYNALMLIAAVIAVLVAVRATDLDVVEPGAAPTALAKAVWPIVAVAFGFTVLPPMLGAVRQLYRERRPSNDSYGFEFAFRLDEPTEPDLVHAYIANRKLPHPRSAGVSKIRLRRLGGWRIERISPDTTLMKVHSVAAVRVSWLRFARFEVVTEVLARRISDHSKFFVRQCRMFGDSPRALPPDRIRSLIRTIIIYVCAPLAVDGEINPDILALADQILTGVREHNGASPVGSPPPTTAR